MNYKYILWGIVALLVTACGEDRRKEYVERTAYARWMETTMQEYYYWYAEMNPNSTTLNYFNKPEAFLKVLRASADSYSYIEDPTAESDLTSYGMHFQHNSTLYAVRLLYVEDDSPAKDAGLKRGDWIIKLNNNRIKSSALDSLNQGNGIEVTRGEYIETTDEETGVVTAGFEPIDTLTLSASRITTDAPIKYNNIYALTNTTVGYIVYNKFQSGIEDGDETYNNRLRQISNTFKNNGVTDVILDLRYNTGGELDAAQLLGSILVPSSALGSTMCRFEYNDKHTDMNTESTFSTDVLGSGSNLDLSRIYVIIGSNTATTADVLINSLSPYMDITLIGTTSAGGYAATHPYVHEENVYTMHLVDCMIANAEESTPTAGHTPDYAINELNLVNMFDFGTEEYLLYSTLYLIETGAMPTDTRAFTRKAGYNSLDRVKVRATAIR